MHSFEVHSNEGACRKSGHLGLDQIIEPITSQLNTFESSRTPFSSDFSVLYQEQASQFFFLFINLLSIDSI